MQPPALEQPLVVVWTPRALLLPLAFAPARALGLLPGPCYVCTAGPVLGSTVWLRPTTDRLLARRAVLLLLRGGQMARAPMQSAQSTLASVLQNASSLLATILLCEAYTHFASAQGRATV